MKFVNSKHFQVFILGIIFFYLFLLALSGHLWPQITFKLIFGWIFFIEKTIKKIEFDLFECLLFSIGSLVLIILIKKIASWFVPPQKAPLKWGFSIKAYFLIIIFFASGISVLALIHNTVWLFSK